jgi:hypothetical protein
MRNIAITAAALALLGVGVAGCNPKKAVEDAKKAAAKEVKAAKKDAAKAGKAAVKDAAKEAVAGEGETVSYKCHMDSCDKTQSLATDVAVPTC